MSSTYRLISSQSADPALSREMASLDIASPAMASPNLQEAIRLRAEEIYIRNGSLPGRDDENWAQAEAEIHREFLARHSRKRAIVLNVEGVKYVGEYEFALSAGYTPGEFTAGDSVRVRFNSGRMVVQRPNGQELETTIVEVEA